MKATNLLLAGAAMAASLPIFAANDPSATAPTAPAAPRSLSDQAARKYPEARRPDRTEKLYHERWAHDEDHRY
jgi:hypothetical protein